MAEAVATNPVSTRSGKLSGLVRNNHQAFLGIPYGKARRFQPPETEDAWSGVRPAHKIGFAAPQTGHSIPGFAASGPQDEDCLNLNVFTPAADGGARPVMVWIHGGGFTHGAGYEELYNGGALAVRGNVVVVTINYRLGALGLLRLPEIGAAGNQALLDQVAALQWVRENIAAFGGDPARVTIFGESAGSAAVGCLLTMPSARGLFGRAIMQSGVGRAAAPDIADKLADALLEGIGLDRARAAELLTVAPEKILQAQAGVAERLGADIRFGPVRDDVTLSRDPLAAIEAGSAADVEVIIGTNRDEVKLFAAAVRRDQPDDANLLSDLHAVFPKADRQSVKKLMETYRASRSALDLPDDANLLSDLHAVFPKADRQSVKKLMETYRASRSALDLPDSNLDILDAVNSDARFRIPSIRWALAQRSAGGKAWLYLFTHVSPARRGALGACHALEMPFVFGTLGAPTQDRFAGTGPDVERLSHEMMDAWLAFAVSGAPSHAAIGAWPCYEASQRPTMIFDTAASRQQNDPLGDERQAFETVQAGSR